MWSDFLPVILFFVAFKLWGIFTATLVAIVSSALQLLWSRYRKQPIHTMQYATLLLLIVLGGTTLWLQDEIYIKWKPTVIYWLFSLAFFLSPLFSEKRLIERLMGEKIQMPLKIWKNLNTAWGVFFALLGGLNIYVLKNFSTEQWVHFKLFGGLGFTLAFVLIQALFLSKHLHAKENS